MSGQHVQIGEVAASTGLSLRTIRYYEEVGLVTPSARSTGGFRLYAAADVDRLELVKRMKPLDFSLDDMRDLLRVVDALDAGPTSEERRELLERLHGLHGEAAERVESLRRKLTVAEQFADSLAVRLGDQRSRSTDA
ncbi:MAG: MerR family transcriptional regulator [Nocardioides sp.]|nr:MerR family transcriptional regulator [Nocardioides sp.]